MIKSRIEDNLHRNLLLLHRLNMKLSAENCQHSRYSGDEVEVYLHGRVWWSTNQLTRETPRC